MKLPHIDIVVNELSAFEAVVSSASDYYPFGMEMPGRSYSSNSYRYGFNGMEKDDEIKGSGNHYDFGLRNYDTRLGRMFSTDPRSPEYPWQTTYAYHRNSPIATIDYLGGGDDWYIDDDGNVSWNDTRGEVGSIIEVDGKELENIGTALTVDVNSYIDEGNDLPVPGGAGDKLTNTLTITGNYDLDGAFSGFTSSLSTEVGKTFGIISGSDPWGSQSNISLGEDGIWRGGFESHTQVNFFEEIGLRLLVGNIVDVNQIVNYSVGANGVLDFTIGHGTYPSVMLNIENTYDIEYQFMEHSFILSHGIGMLANSMIIQGIVRQEESYLINRSLIKNNSSFVKFNGYTAGDGELFSYPHLPKNP